MNKSLGLTFNRFFERYMVLIIPLFLLLGLLFHRSLSDFIYLVPFLFAYITFVMAIGCNGSDLKQAVHHLVPILIVLLLAHGIAPFIAYELGLLFFGAGSPYIAGLVLFTMIPIGVSSVIWVGISGGHVPLVLTMIVIDSAISPLVVPLAISSFFGETVQFDHAKVMRDLFTIIVIPTILGIGVNHLTKRKVVAWSAGLAVPMSKLAFMGVVMINAAVIAPHVLQVHKGMFLVFIAVALLIALFYTLGFIASYVVKDRAMKVSVVYSSGMRNNSLGVVIAVAYFEPLVAVPVILSILLQQPLATLVHTLIQRIKRNPTITYHGGG